MSEPSTEPNCRVGERRRVKDLRRANLLRLSWTEVLARPSWECWDLGPDEDGSRWLHPPATSSCSATIRHGCLFVYSTNTPFEVTEAGSPKGYTKFRAYAMLNHQGDLRAAARALGREWRDDRRR